MSFPFETAQAARDLLCSVIETEDIFFRNFALGYGIPLVNQFAGGLRDQANRIFCNREPPPLPQYDPVNHACEFRYDIRTVFREYTDDGRKRSDSNVNGVWGPLRSFRYTNYTPEGVPQEFEVLCHGPGGEPRSPVPVYVQLQRTVYGSPELEGFSVSVISVIPWGNVPDECGQYPPNPPPYNPPDNFRNINITYNDNSNNPVSLDVTGYVGYAFLDNDLNVNVPVTIQFNPAFSLDPTFNYAIDVVFNMGDNSYRITPPYQPPPQSDPNQPSPDPSDNPNPYLPPTQPSNPELPPAQDPEAPESPPDVPEAEDPPELDKRVMIGALVTTQQSPLGKSTGVLGQDDNPDVYFPDLGLIQFLYRLGGSTFGWSEDIKIKNKRQFVPCPYPAGAVEVRGTPRGDVEWSITPIYARSSVLPKS